MSRSIRSIFFSLFVECFLQFADVLMCDAQLEIELAYDGAHLRVGDVCGVVH